MPDSDDDEDDLTGVAAHERVQRAPRHVDEAFDAMADEYDDDAIGCASVSIACVRSFQSRRSLTVMCL
jgi:hypothetical protein